MAFGLVEKSHYKKFKKEFENDRSASEHISVKAKAVSENVESSFIFCVHNSHTHTHT